MVEGIKISDVFRKTKGEVINLGNPDEKTILELAELNKRHFRFFFGNFFEHCRKMIQKQESRI